MACLVKDNPQRSYFIRVFDIKVSRHCHCHCQSSPRRAPTSLSSCFDFGSSAGGQDHVPAGALPQLLHQQLKVLLHLLCRRRKYCCSSMSMARAGVSRCCLLLLLCLLLIRPARSASTLPVRRRPGGSGPPSATCSTDGSAKQVRKVPPPAQHPPLLLILLISCSAPGSFRCFLVPSPVGRTGCGSNQDPPLAQCPSNQPSVSS